MSKQPAKPNRITGTLKTALDLMVYGDDKGVPLEFDEAARAAGMTVRAMRMAMEKEHVRQYLRQHRAILIASLSATNVRHIATLRNSSTNQMTRLGAARLIEDMSDNGGPALGTRPRQPGIVIVIGPPSTPAVPASAMTLIGSPIPQSSE